VSDAKNQDEFELSLLLAGIEYTMLTTVAPDGSLVSRPLQTLQMDACGVLWFFTSIKSNKVDDIRLGPRVNLAYANPEKKLFVSISGLAEVVQDQAKVDELWSSGQLIFFPRGREDPSLALLKITPTGATYWNGNESSIATLVKLGRAVLTGQASDIGTSRNLVIGENQNNG
jgi:general stress protein 26